MAQSMIPLPAKMDLSGDQAANWQFFKAEWDDYLIASDLKKQSTEKQVATLKVCLGREARQVLTNLKLSVEKMASVDSIVKELDSCFEAKVNVIFERFVFGSAVQEETESVDAYISRLRKLVSSCGYGNLESEMVRDRLVIGIHSEQTKKILLSDPKLDLASAIDKCRANELADSHVSAMKGKIESAVHKVYDQQNRTHDRKKNNKIPCKYCGSHHRRDKKLCPAYGKTCSLCDKRHHFSSVCNSAQKNKKWPRNSNRQHVRTVDCHTSGSGNSVSESSYDEEAFVIEQVGAVASARSGRVWSAKIPFLVGKTKRIKILECQLDTGATVDVLEKAVLTKLLGKFPSLEESSTSLRVFGGGQIKPLGQIKLAARHKDTVYPLMFQVIKGSPGLERLPILSARTCEKMGLVTLNSVNCVQPIRVSSESSQSIIDSFRDVFTGVGCLSDTCKLHVDPAFRPVKQTPRRVAVPLRDELKKKLTELENKGIIVKETGPTEWISNLVIVKTPTKLRLCIDPHHLNQALKRSEFETPTFENITPELTKARLFSVMDTKDGYWNLQLDRESSKLTTFWTPFGRFRWLRLPFGLKVSGDEYQRRLHEIFGGIKNIVIVQDDILVLGVGNTEDEASATHDQALKELLTKAREVNLKFNKQKIKLKMREVKYMGHIITSKGIKPDPEKVKAIQSMRYPENEKEVKSFLGLVTYLAKFVPHLSAITEPLRLLLRKDTKWKFGAEEKEAVDIVKEMTTAAPILAYFDPAKPVVIQADSSSRGLGCVLLQDNHPIAFASRSLSPNERNWANIERECMAILFACDRFASYLIGGKGIVTHTDHKPLERIFQKPLLKAPVRLQRMLLRLQRYDLKVVYIKGKNMHVADVLSRLHLSEGNEDKLNEVYRIEDSIYNELESMQLADNSNILQSSLQKVKSHTALDDSLCMLASTIKNGWPTNKEKLPISIHPYWEFKDEMAIQNGIIFRGNQIVVPKALRAEFIKKIHLCHLGMNASVRRARETLFWPFMSSELKDRIRSCKTCQELATEQPNTPLKSHSIPELPWERVAIDTFDFKGGKYVIVVDAYSDFFEVKKLNDITAVSIIKFCKENFARYGIPNILVSDNAPQFVGQEFNAFSREWEFSHSTSSPMYSRSNGKVESAVKIAKSLLKKCDNEGSDFYAALLEWRNVPTEGVSASPVQRLMSRRTRTTIPIATKLLTPVVATGVAESIKLKRRQAKMHHDLRAKTLPDLEVGEEVLVRPSHLRDKWSLGEIEQKINTSSYNVSVDGRSYRRNRSWLKPFCRISEPSQPETPVVRHSSVWPRSPSPQPNLSTSPQSPHKSPDAPPEQPKNGENRSENTSLPNNKMTTRSGRQVKAPKRFTFGSSPEAASE